MAPQYDMIETSKDNLGRMYGIGIMAFILFLSTLVCLPVLPALAKELGANPTQVAIVISAALATVVVVQLFSGLLADRYSRRVLILTGALIGSASSFLCVITTHWLQLTGLRILGGIADAISMPALLATTATLGKDNPGKFFGILRSSQGLSFIAGPALGSAFSLLSLRMPFIIDGILSLFAFFAALGLVKGTEKAKPEHDLSLFRGLRSTFAAPGIYLFLLMGISGLFGYGILYSFVPIKSALIGLKAWQIGLILTGGALTFTCLSYTVGSLSDRLGRRRFAVMSQLIIVLACTSLVFSDTFLTILISYSFFCIGEAITFLLSFVYAMEVFPEEYIGTSMGAFDSLMDISLFISPMLAITLHGVSESISLVFILASTPALLAFFMTAKWLPHDG